jgi:hypothetical protein
MARVTLLAEQEGEVAERLELRLRLTPDGRIAAAPLDGENWEVAWTGPDGEARAGELVQIDTGWALRHDQGDDDPVWPLQAGVLRPGESVTLREPDGGQTEFRVVSVEND